MRKSLKFSCLLLLIIAMAFMAPACSSDKGDTNAASSGPALETNQNQSLASRPVAKQLSAEEVANKLKDAGLPVSNIIAYTEDNDPNKLLGRPNQYISKANFADTTVEQGDDKSNPIGGSIETFNNPADLKTRKEYCEGISSASPMFAQYYYVAGNYLLRIDHDVSPANAKKYEAAFAKIGQ